MLSPYRSAMIIRISYFFPDRCYCGGFSYRLAIGAARHTPDATQVRSTNPLERMVTARLGRPSFDIAGWLHAFQPNSGRLRQRPGCHSSAEYEGSSNRQTLSVSATPHACATHPFGRNG